MVRRRKSGLRARGSKSKRSKKGEVDVGVSCESLLPLPVSPFRRVEFDPNQRRGEI